MIRLRTRAIFTAPKHRRIPTDCWYDPTNPLELKVVFIAGSRDVQWRFARDLLDEALAGKPAGIGDVKLTLVGRWLEMALTSEDGSAVAYFGASELRPFVAETYRLVPRDREVVDVDSMLVALLGGAR